MKKRTTRLTNTVTESLLAAKKFSFSKIYGKLTFEESSVFFLLAVALIQITPLLLVGFFDRYLIPIIPLVAVAMAAFLNKNSRPGIVNNVLAISFIVVLGAYSILGTKDYLEWNRVRWQAVDMLKSDYHANPDDMDGGFEFNGYYLYNPDYKIKSGKSWWWVNNDYYMISFGLVPGYSVLKEYKFQRWLPPGGFNLYVLRKGP